MNLSSKFSWKWLAALMVVPFFLLTTGCGDDDEIIVIPVEDGVYIIGTATGSSDLSNDFSLVDGRVEGDGFSSNARSGMYEGFGYLSAGDITFVIKLGASETSYGAGSQTARVIADCGDQIDGTTVQTGTLAMDGAGINIPTAGFYHYIIDMTSMTFHAYRIGDMQFTNGFQALPQTSANASGATWRGTDIRVEGNGKFRWNDGWKIIEIDGAGTDCDGTPGNGEWSTAYIIFTNFGKGDNASELRMGGGEWTVDELTGGQAAGLYTVEVTYEPGTGWGLSFTRTGDIPAVDLSGESLEILGLGVIYNGNVVDWTDGVQGQLPSQSGTIYSWTFTGISFDDAQGFKFRTTGTWSGMFNLGCDFQDPFSGPNGSDVVCTGGPNSDLQGTVTGTDYTLVVSIDGNDVANGKTLTVTAE